MQLEVENGGRKSVPGVPDVYGNEMVFKMIINVLLV